jgi:hypothetical protein
MKNIKLLSASVLAITLLSASATVASAAVIDSKTTTGSVELVEDNGANGGTAILPTDPENPGNELPDSIYQGGKPLPGALTPGTAVPTNPDYPNEVIPGYAADLYFNLIPKKFNFGKQKVSAAQQQAGVTFKQESSSAFTGVQALGVHDGRLSENDWHVEAELSAFTEKTTTKTGLAGASITFKDTQKVNQYTGSTLALGKDHTATTFTLTESAAAKKFLSAKSVTESKAANAKGDSAAFWNNVDDLSLTIPKGQLAKGEFSANVTWTLTNTPEA